MQSDIRLQILRAGKSIINMPPEITELILPVTPVFEQALEYPGDRKWVASF
jgi:hypothetical protein